MCLFMCVAACCSDPQHRHTQLLFSLSIYTLWMCMEPLSLFPRQLSYHSADFHRPTLRATGQAALLQESAQDLTQCTSLDIPSKKALRLHVVPGFPPMGPYHFWSLIISFRLFPHLYFFLYIQPLFDAPCGTLIWVLFHLLRLQTTSFYSSCDRHWFFSWSLGGSNIISGWCLAPRVNILHILPPHPRFAQL